MTKNERFLKAFANDVEPDRIPIVPGLDEVKYINLSRFDYWEYERLSHTMLGDKIAWSDRLGTDLYYYIARIPEPNPSNKVEIAVSESEMTDIRIIETKVKTSRGCISQQGRHPIDGPASNHNRFLKDIHRYWPIFKEYFGEKWIVNERYYDEYSCVADSDINIMEALERPPAGNVDFAKAKKRFGDRLCLKSNVSAITMSNGTQEEVRQEVRRCIDAAAAGGGFVLDVGDGIDPMANIENVEVFVETALKYGGY